MTKYYLPILKNFEYFQNQTHYEVINASFAGLGLLEYVIF